MLVGLAIATVGVRSAVPRALLADAILLLVALRPRHEMIRGQAEGHELDLDALVRAHCDLRAGSGGFDRVHTAMRPKGHDLAVTRLVDVSLSTDAWVDGYRVLDVEKEALLVLAHGLSACGDHHSILTFTSPRRSWLRLETVKAVRRADERGG